MSDLAACWCGNTDLSPFCPGYARCGACETLVSAEMPGVDLAHVRNEDRDFYGREYWFSYQERHLGHPTIVARSRLDLPERCVYWLKTLLAYRRPPARVLEVGSGHGGFVALLRWAGFDATGLEVSPWVAQYARDTFGVPVLLGPVEDQRLAPGSFEVIVLMDVLEHLRDPAATLLRCVDLLAPDGILLIQTPSYPEGSTFDQMTARSDRPLEILEPREHLYLFSRRSIRDFFERLGAGHVAFEPALFSQYDMFLVASRAPIVRGASGAPALDASPAARLVQALLDGSGQLEDLKLRYADAEMDRALRLAAIDELGERLGAMDGERYNARAEAAALRTELGRVEADRAARLLVIEEQGEKLGEVEGERNRLRAAAAALAGQLEAAEADRAARLRVIEEQGRRIEDIEAEVSVQAEQIHLVMSQLRTLQQVLEAIQTSRIYAMLRKFGRWKFIDRMARTIPDDAPGAASRRP